MGVEYRRPPWLSMSYRPRWVLAVAIALASVVDFLANAHYQITTWKGALSRRAAKPLVNHPVYFLSDSPDTLVIRHTK